ncbi:MAG: NAD(+)/NADH kinase [Eggerthellaceae bacterium]|nr:NAD(+)/NADH kinase [Eggerthellaceae bacterium]
MNILIVKNQANPEAADASYTLMAYLQSQGVACACVGSEELFGIKERSHLVDELPFEPDLAVILGGDGTIIRSASMLKGYDAPILGINFGHLGFLANDSKEGVIALVSRAMADELHSSRRTCLDVTAILDDESTMSFFAVNEVCISRGITGKTLQFSFDISDVPMANLKGDGLIVSTATGSTGYSLAAGGPLVAPNFDGMIVQPLAPHTLLSRAVLADPNDVVDVRLTRAEDQQAAMILIDGDLAPLPAPISSLQVQRAKETITFLYSRPDHFLRYSSKMFFSTC